jgi:hypothetical protein
VLKIGGKRSPFRAKAAHFPGHFSVSFPFFISDDSAYVEERKGLISECHRMNRFYISALSLHFLAKPFQAANNSNNVSG